MHVHSHEYYSQNRETRKRTYLVDEQFLLPQLTIKKWYEISRCAREFTSRESLDLIPLTWTRNKNRIIKVSKNETRKCVITSNHGCDSLSLASERVERFEQTETARDCQRQVSSSRVESRQLKARFCSALRFPPAHDGKTDCVGALSITSGGYKSDYRNITNVIFPTSRGSLCGVSVGRHRWLLLALLERGWNSLFRN